ncbi:MAG: DUF1569 domain-containing protein [Cyclobacteriaceae bacterium]
MKTLFDSSVASEMVIRIEKISPQSLKAWGKMNVEQMLAHAGSALEMSMGTINPKRIFIGRIIGPIFRKKYSDETPFEPGSPTSNELVTLGLSKDFEKEKERLISLVKKFSFGGEAIVTQQPHPFFGPLTPREWGVGMYKHLDHHLRQFGG